MYVFSENYKNGALLDNNDPTARPTKYTLADKFMGSFCDYFNMFGSFKFI